MLRASCLAVCCLSLLSVAQAQPLGLTVRLHGGISRLGGLDGLNDQISSMNHYFGTDGTWVRDAQGQDNFAGWAPYLNVPSLNNRPDMGISVERDLLNRETNRLTVGVEYAGGANSSSNVFEFSPGAGFTASIFAKETVDVRNFMATCRYSLKDPNLPLYLHAGLGLGYGSITSKGSYVQKQVSQFETDPQFGEVITMHAVLADYDGKALTGRLALGVEYLLGSMSFQFDLGYDQMNFGELDGKTQEFFRSPEGVFEEWAITNAPDTRYEFVPLISESLQRAVDNATAVLRGEPVDESPIDLSGDVKSIEYDLSGGYARFSVGYRF